MDAKRLQEIKARLEAATKGPWVYSEQYDFRYVLSQNNEILFSGKKGRDEANLEFCACARQDIPELIAEIERLKAENDALLSMRTNFAYDDEEDDEP